jgi:hypothetical protein
MPPTCIPASSSFLEQEQEEMYKEQLASFLLEEQMVQT